MVEGVGLGMRARVQLLCMIFVLISVYMMGLAPIWAGLDRGMGSTRKG